MSEEINSNDSNNVAERSEADNTISPVNTLESLTEEINKLRDDFNEKIQKKEKELLELNEKNLELIEQIKKQDALIGDYKEKIFATPATEEELKSIENQAMEQEYSNAFTNVYNKIQHRMTGNNNKELFLKKCLEIYNASI